MSAAEDRLNAIGFTIPSPPPAIANYVGAVQTGSLVFVSGHGPWRDGDFQFRGKVGVDLSLEQAKEAAELVILNCLASLREVINDLDRVTRIVKVLGMVNSDPSFEHQPEVIDAASDILVGMYGDKGRHARAAVGMVTLPRNISVEIEMVVEVRDGQV